MIWGVDISSTPLFSIEVQKKMNEKKFEKRLEFQQKIISRQSEQIEELKSQNEKLKLKIEEKAELINSVSAMREELSYNIDEVKKGKEEYKKLISEVKMMKEIINKEVFKNRWWLIKLLLN